MPYFPPTTGGSTITNWVAYSPVFTGISGTANDSWSRRVGDTLEVQGSLNVTGVTATKTSIQLGFNGSSGNVTIDFAKVDPGTLIGHACNAAGASVPNGPFGYGIATDNLGDATLVNITWEINGAGLLSPQNGSAAFSPQVYSFFFKVPISGWTA